MNSNTIQTSKHITTSFSDIELEKAKKDLISNPCFGVDIPVYEGVPSHIKEHIENINELYNQAQKGLDLYA